MSKFKKDYFWNTIGVLAQNAVSPILLIVITRVNGIEASGLFSFAFAISIVLFAFGLWGGRTYQVSDARKEFDHRSYITARIVLGVIMLGAAATFSLANGYDSNKTFLIIILVLYKAVESIADALYGVLQSHDKLSNAGKSLLYKSIISVILFVFVDISTGSILLGSVALVATNIIIVLLYDARIARSVDSMHISAGASWAFVREATIILKRTWAIFVVTFLATFSINIPRFFIDRYDNDQIAYFGIIAVPITLIAVFMSFILQPNIVSLTKMYANRQFGRFNGLVRRVMLITVGFGILVAFGAFIVGVPVLNLIFGVDFSQHKQEMMVMILGGVANAIVATYISVFIIIRRFKTLFYTLFVSNIGLVITSQFLVPRGGIMAGVMLYACTCIFQAFILLSAYHLALRKQAIAAK